MATIEWGSLASPIRLLKAGPNPVLDGSFLNPRVFFKPAVVKLLSPQARAAEMVCAWIAQEMGLPVPTPVAATVLRSKVQRICEWPFQADQALCFGTLAVPNARSLLRLDSGVSQTITRRVLAWDAFLNVGVFDELVANDDRAANILLDGRGQLWAIDHARALRAGGAQPFSDPFQIFPNYLMELFGQQPPPYRYPRYQSLQSVCSLAIAVSRRVPYHELAIEPVPAVEYDQIDSDLVIGIARLILMPIARGQERVAVAVVGELNDGTPFARAIAGRVLRCLHDDLSHASLTFGSIVAEDFLLQTSRRGGADHLDNWVPPLRGLELGDPFEVEGFDLESLLAHSIQGCVFALDPSSPGLASEHEVKVPRTSEEARFRDAVRDEVVRRQPKLRAGFGRSFSLTGARASAEIDFVGSRYATCFAAINPKGRRGPKLITSSAALWRLARARDAFGFAAPACFELTAWVPPPGLPIYSEAEYDSVREAVAELRAQSKKEGLDVVATAGALEAASRLVSVELVSGQSVS